MKMPLDIDSDILAFLQSFFSTPRMMLLGKGQKTIQWNLDQKTTDILIRAKDIDNAETLDGNKPSILIDRGNSRILYSSLKSRSDRNVPDNTESVLELMYIPYALHCLSSNDDEAGRIASIAAMAIWMHHDTFKPLGYHRIRVDGVGSPTILINEKSKVALYDVPVSLHTYFNLHYRLTHNTDTMTGYLTPVIKEIATEG